MEKIVCGECESAIEKFNRFVTQNAHQKKTKEKEEAKRERECVRGEKLMDVQCVEE